MVIAALTIVLAIICISIVNEYNKPKENTFSGNQSAVEGGNKLKIGFSLGTLKEERWIKDRDILMAKAQEAGLDIIVQNANNDDQDQLEQVKYLLNQGIDVLIIVPNDLNKAAYAVEMAKKQGIPVISYDRLVLNANVDLYITFDNVKVGELMAKHLTKTPNKKNILIVNGAKTDNNTSMIKQGYEKVLKPFINDGRVRIIAEEWAPNWLKEYAFKVTDDALQKNTKIDAIIAGNDSLAEGAIEALSEHRLSGKIAVVGQDADLTACQRIIEGTQLMTIYKPIEKLAEAAVDMAIKLVRNEDLGIDEYIDNGKYNVMYYVLEPIAVDKSNIESTIIRDGFHLREEIFRE